MSSASVQTSTFQLYKRLMKSVKPYRWFFALGIAGTIAVSGVDAGLAWLIKPIINHGLIAKNKHFIQVLPFLIVGIFLARGLAVFLSSYHIAKVGRSVVMDFRQQIFAHMLRLPATFYDTESSGLLISRLIYNVEKVADATTIALMIVVQDGVLAIGLWFVMLMLSWQLTLIFMVIVPLMAFLLRYTSRRLRRLSSNVQKSMGEITHIAEECIEGYRVIRTFGGEQYETDKFNKATRDNRRREMKIVATNALGTTTTQIMVSFAIALVLGVATLPSITVTAGSFAAMVASMFSLLRPIRRITQINNTIQKGVAGAESIFELLDVHTEQDTGVLPLMRAQGTIEYREVKFSYPSTQKTVLKGISFRIEPGETVALVGRSGSGKSTLVSLLPRFYEVQNGTICVDGIDIRDYRLADLRHQFAFVSQHVTLFNDTIARNISYGQFDKVSKADIERVAEAAHVMEFVQELPEGLDTLVGENGVLLSGGQRQRLAIARALLKDAPFLILDEATSALDTESERRIQDALEILMRHRTTLVIAHRLSTIEKADRILVMDKGAIIESGTHAQLIDLNGYYAHLHSRKFQETKLVSPELDLAMA